MKHYRRVKSISKYPIDIYQDLDFYIPGAELEASKQFDHDDETQRADWDLAFLTAMNTILAKKGLRII